MEELLRSPSRQKKRPLSPRPPASQRPRMTKKLKAGLTPHNSFAGDPKPNKIPSKMRPAQKNAVAGPSTQAAVSGGMTQSRYSSRISRPTAKKTTTRIKKRAIVSGSEFDSDESLPSNILPKAPSNLKKRKVSDTISPSKEHKSRNPKARGNGKVVHLGDIELSSDSGDDFATKPAKKRLKRNERKSVSSDVIDLCSDPEESLTPSKTPIRTRMEKNVVIVLSSDDEDHPSQDLFNSGMDVDNSRMETFPKSQGANDRGSELPNSREDEVPIPAMSNRIPSSQNEEIPFQSLQPLLPKARKMDKPKFGSCKVPCFTTSTSARPSRLILFTGDLPNPILHTPGFFSRAITFAKNSVLAAQKRAKKRRLQALLLSSSSLNQESTCTPVQCTRPCEPEVSTLDVPPSSSVAEETVSRRANLRTTPATSPDYPVPVQTKIQENNTFTHPEEITGSYFDEAHESGVAHVPEKPASGVDSPSMDGDGHDLQRNFVGPETPDSTAATSGRPVLRAPTAHDALSINETNHEDNLDPSMLSSRESNSAEPDYVPITTRFKSSRSISEIPEKTRSSAQCLVRVLNDFKMSKKLVNVTTPPPAVVISPHVESSKTLADCSPISLNDSTTSDASEAESPLPVTPPDSHTAKTLTLRKTVSVLDFDLNNLNFGLIGDSKYDDDDDDLSLSGLELAYPDDVC